MTTNANVTAQAEAFVKSSTKSVPALLSKQENRELASFAYCSKAWESLNAAARLSESVEIVETVLAMILEAGLSLNSTVQDRVFSAAKVCQATRANEFIRKQFGLGRMS